MLRKIAKGNVSRFYCATTLSGRRFRESERWQVRGVGFRSGPPLLPTAPNCGPVYRRRRPTQTPLYPLVQHHLKTFLTEATSPQGGGPPPCPRTLAGARKLTGLALPPHVIEGLCFSYPWESDAWGGGQEVGTMWATEGGCLMSIRIASVLIIPVSVFFCSCSSERVDAESTDTATTEAQAQEVAALREWNHRIRREKFDIVLPEVMRKNDVDMSIHVMRETIPDSFGAEDLGSTSGVFVFTDRGGDRIERAVLGRRWGASHAGETWRVTWETESVEESRAYDIVHDPVLVKQPPGGPETEYDYRFQGLGEFVEERDPETNRSELQARPGALSDHDKSTRRPLALPTTSSWPRSSATNTPTGSFRLNS